MEIKEQNYGNVLFTFVMGFDVGVASHLAHADGVNGQHSHNVHRSREQIVDLGFGFSALNGDVLVLSNVPVFCVRKNACFSY